MTRPIIDSGDSYSFSEMLTHFGNTAYTPHKLSNYYGAEEATWIDPDAPHPTVAITGWSGATEISDGATTADETLNIRFQMSSYVGPSFTIDDIVVTGGTLSAFSGGTGAYPGNHFYNVTLTPSAAGEMTIDVAAGVCADTTSGATNTAATQFNWTTTYSPPANATGKILVLHQTANTSWYGDYQLNTITITGGGTTNSYTFDSSAESWEWHSNYTSGTTGTSYATAHAYGDIFSGTIATASTTRRWNRRTGSTPSSSTGISTLGSYYIYTESSGGSASVFAARSPEITLGSGTQTITIQAGSYGSSIGTVYYYWMPDGVTSGNLTNKTLMYTDAQNTSTAIQNLSGTFTV